MNYIIMADGKGTRWNNYGDIPKHFIKVEGETLLARTVRLLHEYDPGCRVTITSHDPRYEVEGAVRYEPKNNVLEIDRFTAELIADDVCFLYGDTYYSHEAMEAVTGTPAEDILFFGNHRSIGGRKGQRRTAFPPPRGPGAGAVPCRPDRKVHRLAGLPVLYGTALRRKDHNGQIRASG